MNPLILRKTHRLPLHFLSFLLYKYFTHYFTLCQGLCKINRKWNFITGRTENAALPACSRIVESRSGYSYFLLLHGNIFLAAKNVLRLFGLTTASGSITKKRARSTKGGTPMAIDI